MEGYNKEKKELIILTDFDLDTSTGPGFSRILCYAKALKKENVFFRIYSTRYRYKNGFVDIKIKDNVYVIKGNHNLKYKTTFEDFHFFKMIKHFRSVERISENINFKNRKTYFLYHSTLSSTLIGLIYFRLIKQRRIFIEKNELKSAIIINFPTQSNSLLKRVGLTLIKMILLAPSLMTDILPVFFNGIIVISTRFSRLYKKFNRNLIKVPIMVIPYETKKNYNSKLTKPHESFTIGYFGTISEKKDGLFSLVKAVLAIDGKNIVLKIYGGGNKYQIQILESIANENPSINYYGLIESRLVVDKISECDLLAFPRPRNIQTNFGFSTKLGEFLISEVPVLTSDVSDNACYLIDNENAFMLKSGRSISIENLTQRLKHILDIDTAEMIRIGRAGHKTAKEFFTPAKYSSALSKFLFPQ